MDCKTSFYIIRYLAELTTDITYRKSQKKSPGASSGAMESQVIKVAWQLRAGQFIAQYLRIKTPKSPGASSGAKQQSGIIVMAINNRRACAPREWTEIS
jgi:hypothetical protein